MFNFDRVVSIGEAMVELAPEGGALYRQGFAGDTFNTIWHMGQLLKGRARAGFVTCLGTDNFSDRFAAEMEADGLDLSGIMRRPDLTMGLYLIELDGVERSFHYWRKDSAARRLADDRVVLRQSIGNAGLIHVSGITLAILSPDGRETLFSVLAEARKAGTVVSFDPNVRPRLWTSQDECRQTIGRMLEITDIALPSFDDEAALWGDVKPLATVERLVRLGVSEVVVKDGAGAVTACRDGRRFEIETPRVERIRDTTGAGDSFNAGYLSGRFTGADLPEAVALGQALSGLVIGCLGARAGVEEIASLQTA